MRNARIAALFVLPLVAVVSVAQPSAAQLRPRGDAVQAFRVPSLLMPHDRRRAASKNGWLIVGAFTAGAALVGAFQAELLKDLGAPGKYSTLETAAIWGLAGAATGVGYCLATHCEWGAPVKRRGSSATLVPVVRVQFGW